MTISESSSRAIVKYANDAGLVTTKDVEAKKKWWGKSVLLVVKKDGKDELQCKTLSIFGRIGHKIAGHLNKQKICAVLRQEDADHPRGPKNQQKDDRLENVDPLQAFKAVRKQFHVQVSDEGEEPVELKEQTLSPEDLNTKEEKDNEEFAKKTTQILNQPTTSVTKDNGDIKFGDDTDNILKDIDEDTQPPELTLTEPKVLEEMQLPETSSQKAEELQEQTLSPEDLNTKEEGEELTTPDNLPPPPTNLPDASKLAPPPLFTPNPKDWNK